MPGMKPSGPAYSTIALNIIDTVLIRSSKVHVQVDNMKVQANLLEVEVVLVLDVLEDKTYLHVLDLYRIKK